MNNEEISCFDAACNKAEKAAIRLIARAEQNSLGLTAKLERRGFQSIVVKEVVSRLLDQNLLNDARYAELWIRSRLSGVKKLSPLWLLSSLAKKGIDKKSSQKALEKVLDLETEYALLINYMEKSGFPKIGTAYTRRAQLKKEGFSYDVLDKYYSAQ